MVKSIFVLGGSSKMLLNGGVSLLTGIAQCHCIKVKMRNESVWSMLGVYASEVTVLWFPGHQSPLSQSIGQ